MKKKHVFLGFAKYPIQSMYYLPISYFWMQQQIKCVSCYDFYHDFAGPLSTESILLNNPLHPIF